MVRLMKGFFLILFLGGFLTGCAAQPGNVLEEGIAEVVKADDTRPLTLFKVTKEGVEPSWLFGTCHGGVLLADALPQDRLALVEGASIFVMEVDPASMKPTDIQARLKLKDGETLESLMGAEQWAAVVEGLKLGPAAPIFNTMHPFALVGFVAGKIASSVGGVKHEGFVAMDLILEKMAAEKSVERTYLETIDQQMDLFLGMEMKFWTNAVADLAKEETRQEMRESMVKALDVCRTGDPTEFLALSAKLEGEEKAFNERLLKTRNISWVAPLEALFAKGGAFVAVGAGHLVGEHSVVKMLEAKGWTVEQQRGVTPERAAVVEEADVATPEGADPK